MKALGVTTRHPKSVADGQTNGGTGRWKDGVDPLPDLLSQKRCRKKEISITFVLVYASTLMSGFIASGAEHMYRRY